MSPRSAPAPIAVLASKGGVGATAVTILAATVPRRHGERSLLVDLTGGVAIAVCPGFTDNQHGVADLLRSGPTAQSVEAAVVSFAGGRYDLLPRGAGTLDGSPQAWSQLWSCVEDYDGRVVIDAGRVEHAVDRLDGSNARRVLVSSRGYESYWRTMTAFSDQANGLAATADEWVLVDSGNMPLDAMVERLDRAPDVLIPWGAIGRWMDEGLLLAKGHDAAAPLEDLVYPDVPDRSITEENDDAGLGF